MPILLVILANLADLLTFFWAVSVIGISGEANPAAAWIYKSFGPMGSIILKAAGVAVFIYILGNLPESWWPWLTALMVGVMVFGTVTNIYGALQ